VRSMTGTMTVKSWVVRWARLGFTDIYHQNVQRRGLLGELYVLAFGTPHLGSFANGIYLRRVLRQGKFESILDAGCGDGTFAFYVAANCPDSQVLGVDIGEQGLHGLENTLAICDRIQGQLGLPNVEFRCIDLRALDFQENFDLIYCFDVLEHIPENRLVLTKFHNALRKGGKLLIRIPTRRQRRMLPRSFTAEHEKWAAIEHVGQHYEYASFKRDLLEIGYKLDRFNFTMGFWGRLSFEIFEGARSFRFPEIIRFALCPFLKLFRLIDAHSQPKSGDGLLVLCTK
jgi:SAM-dependent methyltransferase